MGMVIDVAAICIARYDGIGTPNHESFGEEETYLNEEQGLIRRRHTGSQLTLRAMYMT